MGCDGGGVGLIGGAPLPPAPAPFVGPGLGTFRGATFCAGDAGLIFSCIAGGPAESLNGFSWFLGADLCTTVELGFDGTTFSCVVSGLADSLRGSSWFRGLGRGPTPELGAGRFAFSCITGGPAESLVGSCGARRGGSVPFAGCCPPEGCVLMYVRVAGSITMGPCCGRSHVFTVEVPVVPVGVPPDEPSMPRSRGC
jgi:hypothetical protein